MRILYHSRSRHPEIETELGAEFTSLPELLAQSDFVSLHVPLTEKTKGMLGEAEFGLMKPTAILINTARGAVVEIDALLAALKTGLIRYAALDVTDPEPLPHTHELYRLPNVIILPHIGSATRSTRNKMAILAVDNLIAGLEGKPLPKAVHRKA